MEWKYWLLPLCGLILLLPQTAASNETMKMTQAAPAIFRPVVPEAPSEAPSKTKSEAGEVFGARRGYVHPFLSVGGYYTSNLFNSREDIDVNANVSVVSPGIWLALPASRQQLLEVETLNTAPGGLEVSRFRTVAERRFQGYALYRYEHAEYEQDHIDSAPDATDRQRAEALLLYNFRGGLSVELVDIYEDDHDAYSTGNAELGQLDEYSANLLNPSISYQVTPKLRLQADYSWYVLDYDATRNDFRNREDHAFSGSLFYRFAAKTSVFLDYEYIMVDYDVDIQADNFENRLSGGIQWRATDKSRGRLKLGYGRKEFEGVEDEDRNFFTAEAQLDHKFTPKSSVSLRASRKASETDIQGVRDVLSHRAKVGYTQRITGKITGKVKGFYYRDSYDGEITVGTTTDEREDEKYGGEAVLGYAPTRWLNLSGGYLYTERDSNFDERDYQDHTVYLNITAAL